MNILEPVWMKQFISTTYSCIKGRGIHKCLKDLKYVLRKYPNKTTYCLKFDIKKFYPSINHRILKRIIRRKIKDKTLLKILDEIIDSANGVPIGNYLSQYFANLYLTPFDRYCKSILKCKFYYRYADDIVILSNDKQWLHSILSEIKQFLKLQLKLELKENYQIFPVDSRGIDFVGYVFRHKHTLLRKSIKVKMIRKLNHLSKDVLQRVIPSYQGWLRWCNSKNLKHKYKL